MVNVKKGLTPLVVAVVLLCARPASIGQQPTPSQLSFAASAIAQIRMKLSEVEAKEAAKMDARVEAERNAEKNLTVVRQERAKAQVNLQEATNEVQTLKAAQRAGAWGMANLVEKAEHERKIAKQTVRNLDDAEKIAIEKLTLEKTYKQEAEAGARARADRRAQQVQRLETLRVQWQSDSTENNLIAFTDQVTAISCEYGVVANPFWKSKPESGAIIFYQTVGERRRHGDVHRINSPSDSQQEVCQGRYYVWSERNGKTTSDPNATPYDVFVNTSEVTVNEHP